MKIIAERSCKDFTSYRAARVKSLFNAETGADFRIEADLPVEEEDWSIGLVVGPSGSGKTTLGREAFGPEAFYQPVGWRPDAPIVDCISPDGDFNAVTAALAAVGLGTVPAWLRPYSVLSNGEKFRADLARVICEEPSRVVIDEFTSVVDRQIARFGALAFQKAWRRTKGRCILLSCHYDIIDWVEPDWVFDVEKGTLERGRLWRRPKFELEIWKTDWRYWPEFEPHHYLKVPNMIAAACYIGTVEGERVCHLGMSTKNKAAKVEARACRLVVKPEWQGAGVGLRFLNAVCEIQRVAAPGARLPGRPVTTIFHTSHPGLCAALRRSKGWRQVSAKLYGGNKKRSRDHMRKSGRRHKKGDRPGAGYGGHFRAVQGFRYGEGEGL